MKKVLILTYFFPPGNFAGSYRPASWMEHFHESGLFPVVITRHWDEGQSGFSDISRKNDVQINITGQAEIHYLPYRGNLRDRLLRKGSGHRVYFRRFLSFAELLLQNFTNRLIPFRNLYSYAKSILREQQDIEVVVVTAKPFVLFRFGYLLKKNFPRIRWVADYRDPWNTHAYYAGKGNALLRLLERRSEKKWVGSASLVTSCSETWCRQISEFTGKPAKTVMNGYDETLFAAVSDGSASLRKDKFLIGHIGSLYPMNDAEPIISGIIRLIKSGKTNVEVCFWGLADDASQVQRIRGLMRGFEDHLVITPKLPQEELYRMLQQCDLFLLFGAPALKGWYPVKTFEYLAVGKPILMCPGDHDAAENLIRDVHAGYICYSASEVESMIFRCYNEWLANGRIGHEPDQEKICAYSRRKQAGILAKIISRLDAQEISDPDI